MNVTHLDVMGFIKEILLLEKLTGESYIKTVIDFIVKARFVDLSAVNKL